MELELKKVSLDTYESGGELTLTQEETTETIVPDYCPDIARIIQTDGKVYLHSRELREGKAELSGSRFSTPLTGRAVIALWNSPSPLPRRAIAGLCRIASI